MFYKIKSVTPLPGYKLLVHFNSGVARQYDVAPLFERIPAFQALRDTPKLFEQVRADAGGYGISWNDELDIACNELWENGQEAKTPFDGILAFGDATDLWGLNESTLRKAVSYGKLVNGVDVKKFGKQWVVTESAMRREYGEPAQGPGV